MKKYIIAFGVLFLISSAFATVRPEMEVELSPGNLPTQRIEPGAENVEILKVWFSPYNHNGEGVTLKKFRFLHKGDNRDQFVRYELMQGNKSLGKISLVDSDVMQFTNLNVRLPDNKTTELRVIADTSMGTFSGEHQFSIPSPEFFLLEEDDFRDLETWLLGDFPITANKILLGNHIESPSPECNLREEPVCGTDGKTYYNRCFPFQKDVEILHEGACQHWSFPEEVACLDVYEPVCGDDGKTYSNLCYLQKKEGVFKQYDGECFPEEVPRIANFAQVVELFDVKHVELNALRPRISERGAERLTEISFVLHQYNFKPAPRRQLIEYIENFLKFTQVLSDRTRLEQEIELLNSLVVEARISSAKEKFRVGEIPFLDVDEEAWFLGPVRFLQGIGIIGGYLDDNGNETGLFGPGDPVTKAEITNMLFRIGNIPFDETLEPQNPYAKNHWARDEIIMGEALGLTMWADHPNPDKKADRVEVLRAIFEIFNVDVPTGPVRSSFSDVDYHSPNLHVIQHAKRLGIIDGYPDGTFKPKNSILRAEVAKMMQKVFELLAE